MEEQKPAAASASAPTAAEATAPATTQSSTEASNAQLQQPQTQLESAVQPVTQDPFPIVGATSLGQLAPQNITVNGTFGGLPTPTDTLPPLQSLPNAQDPSSGFVDLSVLGGAALPLYPTAFTGVAVPGLVPGILPDPLQQLTPLFPLNGLAPLGSQALDTSAMPIMKVPTNGATQPNGAAISEGGFDR
jgi:hypothetical protein